MKKTLIIGILSFLIGIGIFDNTQIVGTIAIIVGLALLVVSAKKGGYWVE